MRTIAEIQQILQELSRDIDQLKAPEKKNDMELDFSALSAVARRYPITPHPLKEKDMHTRKRYLTVLLSIVPYDTAVIDNSLFLIHRIAYGADYLTAGKNLKEEYITAQTFTFEQIDEITGLLQDEELRLMLILELLLLAGGFEKGRADALSYIAQLCMLLKVDKKQLTFLSNMAAVILTRDLKRYNCKIQNTYDDFFSAYLKELDFDRKMLYLPDIPLQVEDNNSNLTISIEDMGISIDKKIFVCKCEYKSSAFALGESKCKNVNYQKIIDGRVLLLKTNLIYEYEIPINFIMDKERLYRRLHEPVGVITHDLDSPRDAQNWYIEHGGIINGEKLL